MNESNETLPGAQGPETSNASNHARAMAAKGAAKGGRARANVLTATQRSEIARDAVRARWMKAGKLKQIESEIGPKPDIGPTEDTKPTRPFSMFRGTVSLGPQEYECHVLSDGKRVFTQREIVRALSGGRESGNLQRYLDRNP